MAEEKWEILATHNVLRGLFLTVDMQRVRLRDGRVGVLRRVMKGDGG